MKDGPDETRQGFLIGLLTLLLFCVVGYAIANIAEPDLTVHKEEIKNISRIFMHENCKYTFFISDGNLETMKTFHIHHGGTSNVRIVRDVESDKPMWAVLEYHDKWNRGDKDYFKAEFHIRTVDDINGAGWNHGKFGRGTTNVLE